MPGRVIVRIWSFQHDMWWASNERGYTDNIHSAGVYSRQRAEEICASANCCCPPEKPDEVIREMHEDRP
jgi:hypothetical protein